MCVYQVKGITELPQQFIREYNKQTDIPIAVLLETLQKISSIHSIRVRSNVLQAYPTLITTQVSHIRDKYEKSIIFATKDVYCLSKKRLVNNIEYDLFIINDEGTKGIISG